MGSSSFANSAARLDPAYVAWLDSLGDDLTGWPDRLCDRCSAFGAVVRIGLPSGDGRRVVYRQCANGHRWRIVEVDQ